MTHAVGLRTYQIFITRKGGHNFIDPADASLRLNLVDALKAFVASRKLGEDNTDIEKLWRIDEKKADPTGCSTGVIDYGRYGYAASLRDAKTGRENYRRKRNEAEMLHLFYRFWFPDQEKFLIAAFQSFSGKSCITLILSALKKYFEAQNEGFLLRVRKLMPGGATASLYAGKPVQSLRLVTRKPTSDLSDRLFQGKSQKVKRMSVSIHASKNGSLGSFSDLIGGLPSDANTVIEYDGIEFEEAIATVRIGKELRPIGVFGAHSEVGVIDITEAVVKDEEGLPTYESVKKEADRVLLTIYSTLHGQKK